jgi:hypothetical protein
VGERLQKGAAFDGDFHRFCALVLPREGQVSARRKLPRKLLFFLSDFEPKSAPRLK